jgi:apolipoprotein N-acyltransferase
MSEAGDSIPSPAIHPRDDPPGEGRSQVGGRGFAQRVRGLGPWQVQSLALVAGAVHALAFAPANLPWLELLALGLVFAFALKAPGTGAALRLGLAFGMGWFGVGVSWIYISLHGHGDLAVPLALLATAALAGLLAMFPAAALAAGASAGAPDTVRRAMALAAAWTLADWLRGVVLTGFPWLATGYAHTDGPLAGYAALIGVYGVGAVAALLVVLALHALRELQKLRYKPGPGTQSVADVGTLRGTRANAVWAAIPVVLCLGLLGAGQWLRGHAWSQDQGQPIRVRLVQGNIPQDLKFGEAGLERAIARYLPALAAHLPQGRALRFESGPDAPSATPNLIVFPESAFPVPVNDLPVDVLQTLDDADKRGGAALVFGAFILEPRMRYYNSAIGLGADWADAQRYSKRHLVPFGEFIPYGMHWFVQLLQIPIGDQEAGDEYQLPMSLAGQQIAVNICFEDLFGAEILAAWHDPQHQPSILLNLSNLAWFDDSIALAQHLQISRMRALETARPLLRATNTGVTAFIDERGRVMAQLPTQTDGMLEATVQGKGGSTPFTRWGNTPILALSALVWVACRWMRK